MTMQSAALYVILQIFDRTTDCGKLRQHFDVFDEKTDTSMEVAGRDLITGVPQQKEISVNLVRAAVKEPLAACIREIDLLLERTPPEVRNQLR